MTFRRRRRVNWLVVVGLLIGTIGVCALLFQRVGVPQVVQRLPMLPQPTATATPPIDDGSAALARADSLFDEGRLDAAAEQYGLAAAIAERAHADFLLVADRLAAVGNTAESAARSADAQKALQRAGIAYVRWCKILALRGRAADAIVRCNRAIEINNRSAEAYAFLALAYDRNNEFDKAIAAAQRAIDLDATYAEGYAFLAEAYADKTPFAKRNLETAQKALGTNDKSAFAHRNLGWVYETEGKYSEAAKAYARAVELMPKLSYFYMDLCRAQRVLKRLDDAILSCQKATELDPENAEAHDRLGMLYYEKMDNQKALQHFEKAAEVNPGYALAYGHQGWVYYFRLYAWEKAAAAFEKALQVGGTRLPVGTAAEFYTELGWSYYRLARCSEARTAFDKALGLLARSSDPSAANIIQQAQQGLAACEGKK